MIQLNNLTEVNTAMTELSDRQTCNIQGGNKGADGSKFLDTALKDGKLTNTELTQYYAIRRGYRQ
jgi:hypothetical protein